MRKLYAILVTLLFVTSVFGVVQTMADCPCDEPYYALSQTSVQVGDIFTASIMKDCLTDLVVGDVAYTVLVAELEDKGLPLQIGNVELINIKYFDVNGKLLYSGFDTTLAAQHWSEIVWIEHTFRAVNPGELIVTNTSCGDTVTVTLIPKEYPMFSFMKLLGFGKKK